MESSPQANSNGFRIKADVVGLILGPVLMLGWLFLVDRGSLPVEAHRLAGVLILTITWWLTEPIPIHITGLLAVTLCVPMGVVTPPTLEA